MSEWIPFSDYTDEEVIAAYPERARELGADPYFYHTNSQIADTIRSEVARRVAKRRARLTTFMHHAKQWVKKHFPGQDCRYVYDPMVCAVRVYIEDTYIDLEYDEDYEIVML